MALALQNKIAETISNIGPRVEQEVINLMAEREANKRATAIVTCLDLLSRQELELKKIDRPDQEAFNEKGETISTSYTKDRVKAIKAAKEQIEKITKALTNAVENNDFSGVYTYRDASKSS